MAYKSTRTFVSLPVKTLNRTKEFFSSIGFEFNPQFSDDNSACLVINDNTCVQAAGGKPSKEPADHGFMYVRSFEDLDGHLWEIAYMDMSAFSQE